MGGRREGISERIKSERESDADGEWASVGERERGTEERKRDGDLGGRRVEIERLHSTFLCKLTGLDAQLTGLFWQVSDGPYYYFTARPLGPYITGHNRTSQAGKKNKEKWHGRRVKNTWLPPSAAHWLRTLHSLGIWCMLAISLTDMCVCMWGVCVCGLKKIVHSD